MRFGTQILFMLVLGTLLLGPKRSRTMLGHVARAKAQLQTASRSFKSQLEVELDPARSDRKTDGSQQLDGGQ